MRYVTPANPHVLRTLPLYAPAARVFGYSAEQVAATAAARAIELAGFALADAEEALAHARRSYVDARRAIGDANRGIHRGFTRDRRTARSLAFKQFNRSRAALRRTELHLVAKQAALAALTAPVAH